MPQYDLLGQLKGERKEVWKKHKSTGIPVSTWGRVTTQRCPRAHFGYGGSGRICWKGKKYNVLKMCQERFPKPEWDFVASSAAPSAGPGSRK